jgi:G3E family GTPase
MTNGCICSTLRDELHQKVSRLASANRFDRLLIESAGISEPLPVAQTFTFADENGKSLQGLTRLDTMVTVVDAANFLEHNEAGDSLTEKLLAELESCLLDDRALAMGEEKWEKFRDPFPEWVVQPTDHQHEH